MARKKSVVNLLFRLRRNNVRVIILTMQTKTERNARIIKQIRDGYTVKRVAAWHKITPRRVRAVMDRFGRDDVQPKQEG